jgi:signal peptidase
MAFIGAVVFIALRYVVALVIGALGISPYDRSLQGLFINFFNILPPLIAREIIRAYTLNTAIRRSSYSKLLIPVITVLLSLFDINLIRAEVLSDFQSWFIYFAGEVIPNILESSLLTVLAICGGAAASITYEATLSVYMRILPLLPSLPWIAEGAVGMLIPVIMALLIWEWHKTNSGGRVHKESKSAVPMAILTSPLIALIWFVVGVFPVYPSVILTGSMEPEIHPGDVVLIRKFKSEQEIYALAEGDVINFSRGDFSITHRIAELLFDEHGNISFLTKGDNNIAPDVQPVLPSELNGIVREIVPRVGLPVVWIRGGNELVEELIVE